MYARLVREKLQARSRKDRDFDVSQWVGTLPISIICWHYRKKDQQ